jgi:hypothetical protein
MQGLRAVKRFAMAALIALPPSPLGLGLRLASAQTLPVHPGTCASAKQITNADWELHNNCPFTVYWVVECIFGDNFCAGVGRVIVSAGGTQQFRLGARTLLGPYNTP